MTKPTNTAAAKQQRNQQRNQQQLAPSTALFAQDSLSTETTTMSLHDYLERHSDSGNLDEGLNEILVALAASCAMVSQKLQTHTLDHSTKATNKINVQGEQQKGMDVVANDIFIEALTSVSSVAALASEEEESVIYGPAQHQNDSKSFRYEIAFDPLDGSGNLNSNLPTGSIFGIAPINDNNYFSRPGSELTVAGYALYSASTELVLAFGNGNGNPIVVGFTLIQTPNDPNPSHKFVLSRPNIACPPQGPYYSLNEAREPDWPDGLKRWIHDSKRGNTTTKTIYSSRYICSLCADFHRTLLEGGWAGNPRPHLRLLYEAAPLAFVAACANGKGSDGIRNLLETVPQTLHDRVCVFLGSSEDIDDLESYGDVQQVEFKRYDV